jgi:hypothetical protein
MTDTPQHIKDIHLKLWLEKSPGERLYQAIKDIEEMRHALREFKIKKCLPLGDLDPVGEYLRKKKEKSGKSNSAISS